MSAPQVGQPGQFVPGNDHFAPTPAIIRRVDSSTQVDVLKLMTSPANANDLPYVEVGGSVPAAGDYFQEIALA